MTFKVAILLATVSMDIALSAPDAADFRVQILTADGTAVASIDSPSGAFEFPGIAAGSYVATAVRLDAAGAQLGTQITQAFDVVAVPPATKSVDVPSAMTVTVTPE